MNDPMANKRVNLHRVNLAAFNQATPSCSMAPASSIRLNMPRGHLLAEAMDNDFD